MLQSFKRMTHFVLSLTSIWAGSVATPLWAQETGTIETTPPARPPKETSEKISVIGSRIKRTAVETSTPTVTISREQIDSSGVTTVGELLRTQAVASTGNFAGESGYVRSGAQTSNLYGLGSGRTLVLVDGQRLPKDASLSGTNLAIIPAAIIERVEITTGSKSAVYGSDAVAGVVNLVTRKDFRGTEVRTSMRAPEKGGGERGEISVATGVDFGEGGNFIVAGGVSRENRTYQKNRDWSLGEGKFAFSRGAKPEGTYDFRLLDSQTFRPLPGEAGLWQPSPNCPADSTGDLQGPGEPYRGQFCVGNTRENSSDELQPSNQDGYITTKLAMDVGTDSRLTSFLGYTRHISRSNSGNYFTNNNYLAPARRQILSPDRAAALNLNTAGQAVEIYQVDPAAPDRVTINLDQSYGGFLALESELASGWTTNVSLTHYTTRNDRDVDNVINKEQYSKLLQGYSEGPDGQLTLTGNPVYTSLDAGRDTSLLNAMVDRMSAEESNGVSALTVNASRELFALPGGQLAFNMGIDSRVETFRQTPDPQDTIFWQNQPLFTGTESTSGSGDRNVTSAYAEFLAPLAQGVNLDFALRLDNYSDFGTATNYNVGTMWNASEALTLRANAGTSFRAPELNYIHQVGGGGYVDIQDDRWCQVREREGNPCIAGEKHRIFVDRPGNKDLKPERARTYVIGAIYEPNQNIYLSADYAAFNLSDVFNRRPAQDVVDDFYTGQSIGPASINQDQGNEYITSMANPWMNIGQELVYLVQLEAAFTYKADRVTYGYRSDTTRTISRKEQQADGSLKEWNGYEGSPKWRWNNTLTAAFNPVRVSLSSSTISKQAPDPENIETYGPYDYNDSVPEYTRYDASLDWTYSRQGSLTVGVQNIANRIGGLYRTDNFTGAESSNGSLYASSWNGRSYFGSLTQTF